MAYYASRSRCARWNDVKQSATRRPGGMSGASYAQTEHRRFRLRDVLRYNLQTARAYLLKGASQQLWDHELPN